MISASRGRESFLPLRRTRRGTWLYVTSVNRFLLLYTGEDWEEPAIINSLNKCGWCILGFSALSYHYYND